MKHGREYYDPRYNGTWNYYRHPLGLLYTDSVRDFAQSHHAYWVIDVVASYLPDLNQFPFLILCFDVDGCSCSFYAKEDSGMPDVVRQDIPYTDLGLNIKLYLEDSLLMFPTDR